LTPAIEFVAVGFKVLDEVDLKARRKERNRTASDTFSPSVEEKPKALLAERSWGVNSAWQAGFGGIPGDGFALPFALATP
jgi:hypothetical protein